MKPRKNIAAPNSVNQMGTVTMTYMFSFKTIKSHTALHITHRTIATVSLKERLLHKIPKQIQAVTQSGKRN